MSPQDLATQPSKKRGDGGDTHVSVPPFTPELFTPHLPNASSPSVSPQSQSQSQSQPKDPLPQSQDATPQSEDSATLTHPVLPLPADAPPPLQDLLSSAVSSQLPNASPHTTDTSTPDPGWPHDTSANDVFSTWVTDLTLDGDAYDQPLLHTSHSDSSTILQHPCPTSQPPAAANSELAQHCMETYWAVTVTGRPNFLEAKRRVPSGLNVTAWKQYLAEYTQDPHLVDFLAYGWPMNYTSLAIPQPSTTNHSSADAYPDSVTGYLQTEVQLNAMLGPFDKPPFVPWCQTSPLMTRPKKTSTDRRVILDLSWPQGASVNSGIPRDIYLDQPYKLRLPTADNLADLIKAKGPGCWLYSVDLARAYRQLRSDPLDWPLLGLHWQGSTYIDIAIPFGIRWGAMACHRTTSALTWVLAQRGFQALNYIDDFAGAESHRHQAQSAFDTLQHVLQDVGVQESEEKAVPPTQCLDWIGINFDTVNMLMQIPQRKIDDALSLLVSWKHRQRCTRSQLQKLLGKLFHLAQCCKPARLFVSRMLDTLRGSPTTGYVTISSEFQKDVQWFLEFLPHYNGIQLLQLDPPHATFEVDSCLTGCGGISSQHFYTAKYPHFITEQCWHISRLELLNIVIALKLWADLHPNHILLVHCDNMAAVSVLNNGRSKDPVLLSCAREIWYLCACFSITLQVAHKPGRDMSTADALSRNFQHKITELSHSHIQHHVPPYLFKLCTTF